jgi:hypothetical protein
MLPGAQETLTEVMDGEFINAPVQAVIEKSPKEHMPIRILIFIVCLIQLMIWSSSGESALIGDTLNDYSTIRSSTSSSAYSFSGDLPGWFQGFWFVEMERLPKRGGFGPKLLVSSL